MRNKAFIAAILTLGIGLGTLGISTQSKEITSDKQYINNVYNIAKEKNNKLEQDCDTEANFEENYESISFDEFIGEDIKYFDSEEIEKLKKLYETAAEYELKSVKAWSEFESILENIAESKGIQLTDNDQLQNGEEDGQDYFGEFLQGIKDEIGSDLYEELLKLYEQGTNAENEENYEEADKLWNEIEQILSEKGYDTETMSPEGENEELFAAFNVVNGKIEINKEEKTEKLSQEDMEKYQLIWQRVKRLVPKSYINRIANFNINSDGKDGTLAYVYGVDEKGEKWAMAIDKKDAFKEDGKLDNVDLNHSIIHEFAHILTLNNSQMKKERDEKSKTFTIYEGTTKEKSYLNRYYNKFWKNINSEWEKAQESEDAMMNFYDKYKNDFVSDYAITNPVEDIAESFTEFVIQDKPKGNSVKEQKMLFFYKFKEMTKLRNEIRGNLKKISALK
ncbi:hypothetical protein [Oceanirhabdus seepicola]|uniref:Uncharacterized protein n=1 Tax=Oceanirhabdus seepicola TaxID=2828781 RepID=A0A9J6P6B7_9CLOT|nr:hypothetical protein [Oceanirhabdus seepicola]MCM1991657.1 hypothetical protein [Oceanirhabdus seepicola]